MKDFSNFALEMYPEKKLWASCHADNAASIGLAEALGFKKVPSPEGEVILVRT